jgi:hypothetical protein
VVTVVEYVPLVPLPELAVTCWCTTTLPDASRRSRTNWASKTSAVPLTVKGTVTLSPAAGISTTIGAGVGTAVGLALGVGDSVTGTVGLGATVAAGLVGAVGDVPGLPPDVPAQPTIAAAARSGTAHLIPTS